MILNCDKQPCQPMAGLFVFLAVSGSLDWRLLAVFSLALAVPLP
jgi:hypothetical protein